MSGRTGLFETFVPKRADGTWQPAPDARKRYLVGYSMGGFSVFKIGPQRHRGTS
jgi:enterochelin esterase-like enzyme